MEARDYELDLRWAEGDYSRFPELVADILRRNPSVIMANTIGAIRAARRATRAMVAAAPGGIEDDPKGLGEGEARK